MKTGVERYFNRGVQLFERFGGVGTPEVVALCIDEREAESIAKRLNGYVLTTKQRSLQDDVREFQSKFRHALMHAMPGPRHLALRKLKEQRERMQEELDEFVQACMEQDLPKQADALVDLVYFAVGTAEFLGLPWQELWDDVHRANMAKVAGEKVRGGSLHRLDAVKPPGWVGPRTREILERHGYSGTTAYYDDPPAAPETGVGK